MAPQMGPKEAPMRPKKAPRFPAMPVAARIMPMVAPASVRGTRGSEGIMVERLVPMMEEQKHAGAMDPIARRMSMTLERLGLTTASEASTAVEPSGLRP